MGFPIAQLGRHPKPSDLLGKLLYGVGSLLRATGAAVDAAGAAVQGSYALKNKREPLFQGPGACCRARSRVVRAALHA
jgi:hypothetical protein